MQMMEEREAAAVVMSAKHFKLFGSKVSQTNIADNGSFTTLSNLLGCCGNKVSVHLDVNKAGTAFSPNIGGTSGFYLRSTNRQKTGWAEHIWSPDCIKLHT